MFDRVARRYDLTNTVLSGGRDAAWRRATREALGARPGQTVLDVAAGTAVSTVEIAAGGVHAIACDFSQGMLRAGAARSVPKVAGDAMALPLADESVDAVTISFGLRNVADPDAALREFRRVTRPGGTLVVCEFSSPTWTPFRTVYTEYLMKALPRIARAVSSNPGGLRLSRRVDPRVARPGGAGRTGAGSGLDRRGVAQPLGRDRRAAPRPPGLTTRAISDD